ncbi:type III pantothenate kinase [Anaeromassilibacillus senegalensis]|uniref:Type III pantothenate kinase n=1 Tax=Anaeromassilibacillus senegalensis TaxID=1673717 RepID=A0ABS9CRC7_9FIRM|nr:type III pantothenate kinase [Anaeromassilibacillus senegalensis]MCF2653335.1 type III pantothenate kinase [Anaeromassilibacillus senegalensis]MDD7646599.1 type III pantothenate kinase [Ruminococcus bromii]
MILAIDIGNTNTVIGCCRGEEILFRERVSTNPTSTVLEYAAMLKTAFEMNGIDPGVIDGAILSSVVPAVTNTMRDAVAKYMHTVPLVVGPGIKTGLRIHIDNPAQLGSDLVVDAVAGIRNYPLPQIIIDMGTATTLSVIDRNGGYRGGMILPGVAVSHEALISRAAQLSKIAFELPKTTIGTNTIDCLKSGLLYGNAGALDGLIDRINAELGEPCTVIATGGLSGVIAPLCRNKIILDDDLLLKGLLILYEKNKPNH